jgi:outer membrane protein assembly factor BamB
MHRILLGGGVILLCAACGAIARGETAEGLIRRAGIKGGLVVHLGCGNGRLTAGLHIDDHYLVHGLDPDQEKISAARSHLRARGLYGKVAVEQLESSTLPYRDNLVNLMVVEDSQLVSSQEIERVLCPRGVALVRQDGQWVRTEKPWPEAIDEWTHFLYDASGNAVGNDERVAPPGRLQWTAGPKRTRDHDALASFTTMTSSRGRVFYILDEGPTSQIHRQPRWRLIARDAFNGVPLWDREIPSWVNHLYNFRAGPVQMTRRLVSVGDRVYVTLGYDAPITALDAASGETRLSYEGSENTEEMILHEDVLLSVLGDPRIFDEEAPTIDGYWETRRGGEPTVAKSIIAYEASTGRILWKKTDPTMAYLVPLSLTAGGDRVLYLDRDNLCCLDLKTGGLRWTAPYASEGLFLRNYAPTVVLYEDVLVCLSVDKMAAFAVADGKRLWQKNLGYLGFASPGDVFVINDLVWTFPATAGVRYESRDRILGNAGREFWALDLYTGEVKRAIRKEDVWPGGHHHRCYRNKATKNFALCGRRGLEFVDLTGGDNHVINWWVRGICQYGIMPCNGMVYVPPDPCRCFNSIKVDGLVALAAADATSEGAADDDPALFKGPDYEKQRPFERSGENDCWPTYRHDTARSGSSNTMVPARLETKWSRDLGAALSGLVVAGNRVYVGAVDEHTVYCLDATTGERLWSFTAGGPVDSPPTVSDGLAVFGSRDGHVYAVAASDGQLAWRFRGAPRDRRIVDGGQLESVWPIHGSVLVLEGKVYFASGRSSFLDGGIHIVGLDLHTGEERHRARIESLPVDDNNSGALPDILMAEGSTIHMRQLSFDKQLQPVRRRGRGAFSATTGLLENEWGHRLTWQRGAVSGNLLVFDDETVFGAQARYAGWKKDKGNWPPTHTGHLHQKYSRYQPEWFPIGNRVFAQQPKAAKAARRRAAEETSDGEWALDMPIQIRAMVLARDKLFAAGWPDSVTVQDRAEPAEAEGESQIPKLWVLSTQNGQTLAEYDLDALPVFDGSAVAYGRLFMPLQNGHVVCFGG